MTQANNGKDEEQLIAIFRKTMFMSRVEHILERNIVMEGECLSVQGEAFPLNSFERIFVAGVGTCAHPFGVFMDKMLGNRISQGILLIPPERVSPPGKFQLREVTSPVVDPASKKGLKDLLFILGSAGEKDLVILFFSKGTTEMLEDLQAGISFNDYSLLIKKLQSSGAGRDEISSVRKHLSTLKGGQMLRKIKAGKIITLILSDEPGGDLSGTFLSPTFYDATTFQHCRKILIKYNLPLKLPSSLLHFFDEGIRKKFPETLKPNEPPVSRTYNFVLYSSTFMASDALESAEENGLSSFVLTTHLNGEPYYSGQFMGNILKDVCKYGTPVEPPGVFIATGKSGSLRECCDLAISTALEIRGMERTYLLSSASFLYEDDGFSGCLISGKTADQIEQKGLDPINIITTGRSADLFKEMGCLIPGKFHPNDCGNLYLTLVPQRG